MKKAFGPLIGTIVFGFLSRLHGLGQLYNPGGPQAGSAKANEFLRVRQAGNASGGLDLHMGRNMLGKKRHIMKVAPPLLKPVEVLI